MTNQFEFLKELLDEEQYARVLTELDNINRDNSLDIALIKSGAKSLKAVKALVDLEKLEVENGEVKGIDEQIKAIKGENAFLFAELEPKLTGGSHTGGLTDYDSMSDEEYYKSIEKGE